LKKLKTTSGTSLKRGKQNVKAFDEVDSDDSDEEMDDLDGLLNLVSKYESLPKYLLMTFTNIMLAVW